MSPENLTIPQPVPEEAMKAKAASFRSGRGYSQASYTQAGYGFFGGGNPAGAGCRTCRSY